MSDKREITVNINGRDCGVRVGPQDAGRHHPGRRRTEPNAYRLRAGHRRRLHGDHRQAGRPRLPDGRGAGAEKAQARAGRQTASAAKCVHDASRASAPLSHARLPDAGDECPRAKPGDFSMTTSSICCHPTSAAVPPSKNIVKAVRCVAADGTRRQIVMTPEIASCMEARPTGRFAILRRCAAVAACLALARVGREEESTRART